MFKSKKIKKLIRDPELYFSDWLVKSYPKNKLINKKIRKSTLLTLTENKYSVVSAVYGVEKYLDDYFESLVNQSIGFVRNIELIMVDDGSLDESAEIIKKWQKLYPENIKYIKKENGGQASARNLGLDYVTGNWVTFIDPDDFVDVDYFYEINRIIDKKEVAIVSTSVIFYYESNNTFSDSHPLSFKFDSNSKNKLIKIKDIGNRIQLSMSSAIFQLKSIKNLNLKINEKIKPNFEDGHFVNKFLLNLPDTDSIYFSERAKYFYRKREDASSTLDTAFFDSRKYLDVVEFGYLDLLKKGLSIKKEVPNWLQNVVLYDLTWLIKGMINHENKYYFLTKEQKKKFLDLCVDIFAYIDEKTILQFNLAGSWFYHKIGFLNVFKNITPKFNIFYIENVDEKRNLISVRYFSSLENISYEFYHDKKLLKPLFSKKINHDLFGNLFLYEYNFYLEIKNFTGELFFYSDIKDLRVSYNGKQYRKKINNSIFSNSKNIYSDLKNYYYDSWLFMDRDTGADDNAEHLYRYVTTHSNENCYFILRKSSNDWDRLEKEGFKLIEFGSENHEKALLSCSKLISSHADYYIFEPIEGKKIKNLCRYHFVFLQHGIIQNNLSNWLNSKEIDLFITSTAGEYSSIISNDFNYKFNEFNVKRIGLSRYDRLFHKKEETRYKKSIIIMPTWRQGIVGTTVEKGNERNYNEGFFKTSYYLKWSSFLNSNVLSKLKNEFDIIFFPHANIQNYLDKWDIPDFIQVKTNSSGKYFFQDNLLNSSVLITDYSSVAFDFSYLRKPVIYFQFDSEEVESGQHIYQKGYFDYELDGFGPVVESEQDLIQELLEIINNDCVISDLYLKRVNDTFDFEDGLCCFNTYKAIKELDEKLDTTVTTINKQDVEFKINLAKNKKLFDEVIRLTDFYLTSYELSNENIVDILESYIDAICYTNKYIYVYKIIDFIFDLNVPEQYIGKLLPIFETLEDWSLVNRLYSNVSKELKFDEKIIGAYEKSKIALSSSEDGYNNLMLLHHYSKKLDSDASFYMPLVLSQYYKISAPLEADLFLEKNKNQISESLQYREFAQLRCYQGYFKKSTWHFKKLLEHISIYTLPIKTLCLIYISDYLVSNGIVNKHPDIFKSYWFNSYLSSFIKNFNLVNEIFLVDLVRLNNELGFYDLSYFIIHEYSLIAKDKSQIILFSKTYFELNKDFEGLMLDWNDMDLLSSNIFN